MGTILCDLASQPWPPWLSKDKPRWGLLPQAVAMPTGTAGTRLSARRGIVLVDIYLALLLEMLRRLDSNQRNLFEILELMRLES